MKKRLLLFLCALALLLSTAAQAVDTADLSADTPALFARTRVYDERFADVSGGAWYHDSVAALY